MRRMLRRRHRDGRRRGTPGPDANPGGRGAVRVERETISCREKKKRRTELIKLLKNVFLSTSHAKLFFFPKFLFSFTPTNNGGSESQLFQLSQMVDHTSNFSLTQTNSSIIFFFCTAIFPLANLGGGKEFLLARQEERSA